MDVYCVLDSTIARDKASLAEVADRFDLDVERILGARGLSLCRPLATKECNALRAKVATAIVALKASVDEVK